MWGDSQQGVVSKKFFQNLIQKKVSKFHKGVIQIKDGWSVEGANPEPGLVSELQPDDLPVGLFSSRLATKVG